MTPKRIHRRRSKGFVMPANTVYVGRGTYWGNPWRVSIPEKTCKNMTAYALVPTAEIAVEKYRCLCAMPSFIARAVEMLRGKNLACWCPPDRPCHADLLLEIANNPMETTNEPLQNTRH